MTEEQYERRMGIVSEGCGGNFLIVHLSFMRYFKGDGSRASGLAFILNRLKMKDSNPTEREQLIKNKMWFKCPAKDMQTLMGMAEDRQRAVIKTLVDNGLIKTKRRKGNVLWIKVMCRNLRDLMREKTETGKSRNRNGEIPHPRETGKSSISIVEKNLREESKEKRASAQTRPPGSSSRSPHHLPNGRTFDDERIVKEKNTNSSKDKKDTTIDKQYINWASRLHQILKSRKRKWSVSNRNTEYSANRFRIAVTKDGFTPDEINARLEALAQRINEIEKPSITGADQFFQHWVWMGNSLEALDAKERGSGRWVDEEYTEKIREDTSPGRFRMRSIIKTRRVWQDEE